MPFNGDQPRLDPTSEQRRTLLTHDEYLATRLHLHAIARFVVIGLIVTGAWLAGALLGIEELDAQGLSYLAGAIVLYNLIILVIIRPRLNPAEAAQSLMLLRGVLYSSMLADYIALTIAIWFVGGSRSPFLAFYLFHVIIASLLLSRAAAWAAALCAWLMLSVLILGELSGLIPTRIPAGLIACNHPVAPHDHPDERYFFTVLAVYGILFLLTAALLTSIAEILRRGERSCRDNICELERLSDMRRDFLHITTHNLQSPVGAATMLLRNLDSGLCGEITGPQHDQVGRAVKRLEGLSGFLADLRMLTQLDTGETAMHAELVDVRALLAELADANTDTASSKGHTLILDTDEPVPAVWTTRRLLREAIDNYITNAIKYTPDGGTIRIGAKPVKGDRPGTRIEITDNGIGIDPEDQKRLFQELVRIKINHPRLGQVKGTGLGLSIVRRVINALGGRGGVISEPGKGSTFWIELPAG